MKKFTMPNIPWRKPSVDEALTVGLAFIAVPLLCLLAAQLLWVLFAWLDPASNLPGIISTTVAIFGGMALLATMGLLPLGCIFLAYALVKAVHEHAVTQEDPSA